MSPVDYSIQLGKRSKKVFHVNMLKEWISREEEKADDSKHAINAVVDTEQPVPSLCIGITENEDIETDNITNPLLVAQEGIGNVVINETLEVSKKGEIRALLETFEDVLTDVPGKTNLLQHDVKLNSDVPVSKKAYILPYAVRDKVKKDIQDTVEAGIAEKSTSPYAAPIVIVPKKDNTIRLCVDYRQLNKVTIFDPQPMPKLEDIINKLGKAHYISKIDLTKGFWQIPLTETSKEKGAFITPFGHYQFSVMPFGMIYSSASFVRLIRMVLSDCEEFTDAFIDDIIIFSEGWYDHLKHIKYVLESLRKAHLSAKPSKCMFAFLQIEFLAHIVGNGEVRPKQEKIEAIQKIPIPETKKQVRSFIDDWILS